MFILKRAKLAVLELILPRKRVVLELILPRKRVQTRRVHYTERSICRMFLACKRITTKPGGPKTVQTWRVHYRECSFWEVSL